MPVRRRSLLFAAAPCALALPPWLREVRAGGASPFGLGVASGQPRPDGMVLWTRLVAANLPPRVDVQWELAHDEAFARIAARGSEVAEAAWAHSVHAEPAGLESDRWYWYRFRALGAQSPAGRTRTAPAPDAAATLATAIASCQRWDHGHYAAWRHLARRPLDLVLFLGDYIYEYASRPGALRRHEGAMVRTLADYRARYAQYKSDPALQAAHAAAPWLMVWDDHEVENDYAGTAETTPTGTDQRALRAAAYRAYWEHLPFAQADRPRGADMRLHRRCDWGRLARIHLLDGRQHRDLQACPRPLRSGGANTVDLAACPALADPARTLLGAEQEQWLAEGWSLDRPWNLLAQQTLMARYTASPEGRYWTDGWDGYPAARRRLLATVAERRVPGVVALGGDVHAHLVADLKLDWDDTRAPVLASEFCGTSISSAGRPQRLLDAALPFNPHLHHARSDRRGHIEFSIGARELQARLMAVDEVEDPASAVHEVARFVVDAARPGPQRA